MLYRDRTSFSNRPSLSASWNFSKASAYSALSRLGKTSIPSNNFTFSDATSTTALLYILSGRIKTMRWLPPQKKGIITKPLLPFSSAMLSYISGTPDSCTTTVHSSANGKRYMAKGLFIIALYVLPLIRKDSVSHSFC